MNKIDMRFKELKEINKTALIPFIAIGSRKLSETIEIINVLKEAGIDMLEIGMPYSDPLADGPEIQDAYNEALLLGIKVEDMIDTIKKIELNTHIPIIVRVYYNVIFSKGVERFLKKLSEAGVSGLIVPDIPLEEMEELNKVCSESGMDLIPIVTSTSKERIKKITKEYNKGFVYCLSNEADKMNEKQILNNVKEYLQEVRNSTNIPICLNSRSLLLQNTNEIKGYYDGIIIESELVKIMSFAGDFRKIKEQILKFAKKIQENI